MIHNLEKIAFGGVVAFHLFWLFIGTLGGKGILLGHVYYNQILGTITGLEQIIFVASFVLIYKNSRIGYVFLVGGMVISYTIHFGHRFGIYECRYCGL